jgi:IS605 OrfB family transposase
MRRQPSWPPSAKTEVLLLPSRRNAFKAIKGRLAKAQRKLSRKTKFSVNWRKQKAKISRLYMQAGNARRDFLHKLSTQLAKSHGVIKLEKLQVQNMSKSAKGTVEAPSSNVKAKSGLNRSILDQGWGRFATMLKYKLTERGGELQYVDPAYTSQSMLVRSTKWSWLKAWAMKVARHRGMKKAIVALARRLAVIMHRMWVDGTEFRWTREVAAA